VKGGLQLRAFSFEMLTLTVRDAEVFCIYSKFAIQLKAESKMIRQTRAFISWEGNSLEVLKEWPRLVQHAFGFSLLKLQEGQRAPLATRPMKSIGSGVFELKAADEAAWYRVIYLARIEDTIYVLDSFTKKSRKTEKNDLSRSKARLAQVKRRIQEEKANAKRKSNQ